MSDATIDILMVTHNRQDYTQLSLPRLLETCDPCMRVWLWHNGNHESTLEFVRSLAEHPRVFRFHHCPQNKRLWEATNWLFSQSDGQLLAKVDDDTMMPVGCSAILRAAHAAEPRLGVLGCWPFMEQDVVPELVEKKLMQLPGGGAIMRNCWVGGAGFVLKRACAEKHGLMRPAQTFPNYCVQLAAEGWINGWYYPFLYMAHMDDPRSPFTALKTEADLRARVGLSARRAGVKSLQDLRDRQVQVALHLQQASFDPRQYVGWRAKLRHALKRISVL